MLSNYLANRALDRVHYWLGREKGARAAGNFAAADRCLDRADLHDAIRLWIDRQGTWREIRARQKAERRRVLPFADFAIEGPH